MDVPNPVLAQKLGLTGRAPSGADPKPATPMRQMRRALGRAADKAVGLSASVLGIAEEDLEAEQLIETGPEGWVVLGLRDGASAGLTGLFLIDPALRSALVDMQTMGNLMPQSGDPRAVTRTDGVLAVPFAARLLSELSEAGFGAAQFNPAGYDLGPIDDLRTAGLVMVQGGYRSWRITIQMGGTDAQGEMLIAMRAKVSPAAETPKASTTWSNSLRGAVQDAPADLDAVLSKMTLPIHKIEAFEVGQVLKLAGTTVGSVHLAGPDGEIVTSARLGQVAGKRAVRIQATQVQMQDAPPKIGAADVVAGIAHQDTAEPADTTAQPSVTDVGTPPENDSPIDDLVAG